MEFVVRQLATQAAQEFAVYAVDPREGNDAGLLTVFGNKRSAEEYADFMSTIYDIYLRSAPMPPASRSEQPTVTQKSGDYVRDI